MENSTGKKIICKFCAAKFDEMLPSCPYCGSTNYKGAEAEYFEKLEDVRENMENLEEVPEEETKKEIRKQGNFLKKVFIVISVFALLFLALKIWLDSGSERDEKAGFLWRQENIPVMNELYEQGKYEEMVELFHKAYNNGVSLYDWEHCDFCEIYENIIYIQDFYDMEAAGKELTKAQYAGLLFDQWQVIGIRITELDEQELAILGEYSDVILEDFEERWNMSDEDYARMYSEMEENLGYIRYSTCEKYIDKWYEENK